MTSVVATTVIVGSISGRMIRRKTMISLAPSSRDASRSSTGTPFSAADRMTVAKPAQAQTPTTMISRLFVGAWASHGCGSPPNAVTIAFRVPVCSTPGGWYA